VSDESQCMCGVSGGRKFVLRGERCRPIFTTDLASDKGAVAGSSLTLRPAMRVLLIEDDRMLGEALVRALRDASYAVDWAQTIDDGLSAAALHDYGAVLLDLNVDGRSGLDALRQMRARGNAVPVLIITASQEVEQRIAGLDRGADDYILKPFDIDELKARMRAVVRRKAGAANPILTNGEVTLNPATREATLHGVATVLPAREFALLHALLLEPGVILSRKMLEERIYGWNEEVESNAVEFLIHAVRRKLGPGIIKNIRGIGWTVPKRA
jgi:two-component system, OmpR family, response regulator